MPREYKIPVEKGYYIYKLEQVLFDRNISKNQILRDTETDYNVLKRLYTGDITKLDTTVLARFCDYLNCGMTDLVEYYPNKEA